MHSHNQAGGYAYRARCLHEPTSVEELVDVVERAERLRVIGTRHSFTGIADSDELVSLEHMPGSVVVAEDRRSVSVPARATYAAVASVLHEAGLALHNTASLPHVSVGGAIATATHGSGDALGNLATAVVGLELVSGTGEVVRARRGDDGFEGLVVHLGALGAVTRVELEVEPAYLVRQRVHLGLTWEVATSRFDEVMAAGRSVSLFTVWDEGEVEQVWVKERVGDPEVVREDLFGAAAARQAVHPIRGLDPAECSEQLGVPGPWWARLPHFRSDVVASAGREIQSELHLPREHAAAAIEALRALGPRIAPLVLVSEIRTVAADGLWMSPMYDRPTVSFHFTWRLDHERVHPLIREVERVLEPFSPRPHWGKVFFHEAATVASRYRRLPDFIALTDRLDPRGVFRNDWFDAHLGRGRALRRGRP